jgi:Schlafen, AlbA_2
MALLHIPLATIDEVALQNLIRARVTESRSIDYKRETYGNARDDYAEFLADISSFANTAGGDVVIGVAATDGIPTAIVPFEGSVDSEILRLDEVARGGLQPRLPSITFHPVPVQAGGHVIIVRVPRSYNPPHRVVRQGSSRFWARSSAGKYEPNVDELRALFTLAPQLTDRMRNFRFERIAKIAVDQGPVQLMNRGTLVLHIIPFSAFDISSILPIEVIVRDFNTFPPLGFRTAQGRRVNFDGVLMLSNADQAAQQQRAYVQVFRNGIVEAVNSTLINQSRTDVPMIPVLDNTIINNAANLMRDLKAFGVEPPFALLVSLVGVRGARFNFDPHGGAWYDNLGDILDRDQYHFGEIIFETIPVSTAEFAQLAKPLLDQMANAGGNSSSISFDRQGNYIEPLS